jgi:hypothetical protein
MSLRGGTTRQSPRYALALMYNDFAWRGDCHAALAMTRRVIFI